jgi:hypothetical protein
MRGCFYNIASVQFSIALHALLSIHVSFQCTSGIFNQPSCPSSSLQFAPVLVFIQIDIRIALG